MLLLYFLSSQLFAFLQFYNCPFSLCYLLWFFKLLQITKESIKSQIPIFFSLGNLPPWALSPLSKTDWASAVIQGLPSLPLGCILCFLDSVSSYF